LSLAELSDSYPKSLYLYNLTTKEYKLLKEQKDTNLSGGVLSADKKHLLYTEYTLGDPAFFVMNMDTLKTFVLQNESIAGAMSAKWTDNEVIGAAYIGGAYTATASGEISVVKGLEEESLFLVDRINDKIYYNTSSDETLKVYNTATKEKSSLELKSVSDIIPSPDKNQMLVVQYNGSKQSLLLSDTDGSNQKTIAEGTELGGVSWSPDQRLIAYNLQADVNGSSAKGLYVYDVLTGTSTQIAVDTENAVTAFGPTGKELFISEYNGTQWNSSIIYLK
jgi:TolB protein